ncbi:MAG: hypothetical protein OEZ59_13820, partial [Deltaproteobacteria bacterium]|nr:hypothetical protein [Deltaproteobacteria bacterium]
MQYRFFEFPILKRVKLLSPFAPSNGISPILTVLIMAGLVLGAGLFSSGAAQAQSQVEKDIEVLVRASKARAAIVRMVSPAVVHISVEKTVGGEQQEENGPADPFDDEFFRRFFAPRLPVPPREFRQRGLGSGTIVDKAGYILTNNHVIEDADKIIVKLKD